MKRFVVVASMGLSLFVAGGHALAQDPGGAVINADGNSGASNAGTNPAVDADGPTVVYGDLNTGPGNTVIGPPISTSSNAPIPGANITATDGNAANLGPGSASAAPGTVTRGGGSSLLGPDGTYSVSDNPESNVSVGDSGAYVPPVEPAPIVDDTVYVDDSAAAPVDTAAVADSDGDGLADEDEINIYGTDPYNWDTDGDGLGDAEEVFATGTDPLLWDDTSGAAANDGGEVAAAPEATDMAVSDSGGAEAVADSDGDRLADADEAALGTDPGNPDSDGDGYYDGDEANLGTDPFDANSMPAI